MDGNDPLLLTEKTYPWDNACFESFHVLIKREWLHRFKIHGF